MRSTGKLLGTIIELSTKNSATMSHLQSLNDRTPSGSTHVRSYQPCHQPTLNKGVSRVGSTIKPNDLPEELLQFAHSLKCATCGDLVDRPSAYCGYLCRQKAAHIRYGRAKLLEGIFWRFDILDAIYVKVCSVSHGGYNLKARSLSLATRRAVHKRSHGMCELCDKHGAEIHHAKGSSSALENLQLLCKDCHDDMHGRSLGYEVAGPQVPLDKTMSRKEFEADFLKHLSSLTWGDEYIQAIFRETPLRNCYDPKTWQKAEWAMRAERTKAWKAKRANALDDPAVGEQRNLTLSAPSTSAQKHYPPTNA